MNRLLRGLAAVLLCLAAVSAALPMARAGKTVRVGWYESPFNRTDRFGRRSGYAYEYQQRLAAYTGWDYEYVEGSWPELLQLLMDGQIDLLSDVSHTQDRDQGLLFPSYAMGEEEFFLFVTAENAPAASRSFGWYAGKKIGVNKGSVQAELFRGWMKDHRVQAQLIELTSSEAESVELLRLGRLDGLVTVDSFSGAALCTPVAKVGSSAYYFAVNRQRPDLLEELESALSRVRDEDRYYPQRLYEKYLQADGAGSYLTPQELAWLTAHGPIRVGYQDKMLSFCGADGKTGELTGGLRTYLDAAAHCLGNAQLDFEPVAYPTAAEALEALRQGQVDCVFPVNLSISDAQDLGLSLTPALMEAHLCALVPLGTQETFFEQDQKTVAVPQGCPNTLALLRDHFPRWKMAEYPALSDCLQAVSTGEADCGLIGNYQYNDLALELESYQLTLLPTGEDTQYTLALRREDTDLYSILTRTTGLVSHTAVSAALAYYAAQEGRTVPAEVILENPRFAFLPVVLILVMLGVILFQHRMIQVKRDTDARLGHLSYEK